MAYVKATTTKGFTVTYKCVNCGNDNKDVTYVEGVSVEQQHMIYDTSVSDAKKGAATAAWDQFDILSEEVKKCKFGKLNCIGKCNSCGTVQPWATGTIKKNKILFTIIAVMLIAVAVLVILLCNGYSVSTAVGGGIGAAILSAIVAPIIMPKVIQVVCESKTTKAVANMVKNKKMDCYPKVIDPTEDK